MISDYIQWTLDNPVQFFLILFFQYALLATYQHKLKKVLVIGYPLFWWFILQDWWPVFTGDRVPETKYCVNHPPRVCVARIEVGN